MLGTLKHIVECRLNCFDANDSSTKRKWVNVAFFNIKNVLLAVGVFNC